MHEIPEKVKPPSGEALVLRVQAAGFQVYVCQEDANGKPAWVLKAPEAELRDEAGTLIGRHYGGPTWKHHDGSEITARLVARVDAPDPEAIPWLLLTVTGRSGDGVFRRATTIQRIHTAGGKAPAALCDADAEVKVPYTAVYSFYAPGG